ncbi:hypothetical protein F4824DRAFT_509910 [Ustulina deusta]|nr:hypothetical protein F4824DRAFT_509910 [Ustulina deusta]
MAFDLPPDYVGKIRDSPAASPPPGVIPNFDNPPNNDGLAIAVIISSIVITTLAVLIRVYSKVFCTRRPFFIAGTLVLVRISRGPGFFVHLWNLHVRDLEEFLYAYVVSTTLFCVTLLLAKVAILLEWTHIFVVKSNRSIFYWTCYGMIAVNTALYLATIITITNACNPRERIWQRYLPGTCIDLNAFNIFITVFHLISDILMLLLPQMVIWKLRLATKQKVGVSVVFSGGAIACVWAAGRVASAIHLSISRDTTGAYSQYIMWGLAEVTTSQIIFCVPAFPIIFRQTNCLHRLCSCLRSKTTIAPFPQRFQLNSTLSQSSPETDPQTTSDSRSTVLGDGGLTELEPTRLQSKQAFDEHHGDPESYGGRILITTEINITTQEGSGSRGKVKPKTYKAPWQR